MKDLMFTLLIDVSLLAEGTYREYLESISLCSEAIVVCEILRPNQKCPLLLVLIVTNIIMLLRGSVYC